VDKLTITAKIDIKAGTQSLLPATPLVLDKVYPDGAPAPLYAIPPHAAKTIEIAPVPPPPGGASVWAVSFVMVSADTYDPTGNITYAVDGKPVAKPPAAASSSSSSSLSSSSSGASSLTSSDHADRSGTGSYDPASQQAGTGHTAGGTNPPATGATTVAAASGRVFSLEYPHLFLGPGAVKLLSTASLDDKTFFEPQKFMFWNNTDDWISVSVYIGRTHYPPEFDLQLMSWGDGSGVPTSGKSLVIVGIDNKGLLHIRIFDANGNRITDMDETKLPGSQAGAIATLKQQLPGFLPPHVLTGPETAQVMSEATSIVGQTNPPSAAGAGAAAKAALKKP
jgi:hypothetical protein